MLRSQYREVCERCGSGWLSWRHKPHDNLSGALSSLSFYRFFRVYVSSRAACTSLRSWGSRYVLATGDDQRAVYLLRHVPHSCVLLIFRRDVDRLEALNVAIKQAAAARASETKAAIPEVTSLSQPLMSHRNSMCAFFFVLLFAEHGVSGYSAYSCYCHFVHPGHWAIHCYSVHSCSQCDTSKGFDAAMEFLETGRSFPSTTDTILISMLAWVTRSKSWEDGCLCGGTVSEERCQSRSWTLRRRKCGAALSAISEMRL